MLYAPDRKRGKYGSFLEFGTLAGFTLGAALALVTEQLVGADDMADWGWRLPFLIAGPLGIIGQTAMMVLVPFAGAWSDKVGRKTLWWISIVGLFVLAIPMFQLMARGFVGVVIAFAVRGLLYVPQLSTISAMFPAMFPTHIRYAGFAIAYNVSTSLFGGTAPAVNQSLINATDDLLFPAYYMMAACVIGAVALYFVPETRGCSLRGRGVPGIDSKPEPEPVAAR